MRDDAGVISGCEPGEWNRVVPWEHDHDCFIDTYDVLLELGEQVCDLWNDSEAARAEMRDDILCYPPHQRAALMTTLEGSLRADKPRISLDGFTSAISKDKF